MPLAAARQQAMGGGGGEVRVNLWCCNGTMHARFRQR